MIQEVNTKEKILKEAAILFSKKGYFGVSMDDIAENVGVGKSALYYHFESKEALLRMLMNNACGELKLELQKAVDNSLLPSDYLFNIVLTFLDFRVKHPEITLLSSSGFSTDDKVPALQFIVDQRMNLTKFLRTLLGGTNTFRMFSYSLLQTLIINILGFVLNPLIALKKDNKDAAEDFSNLVKVD